MKDTPVKAFSVTVKDPVLLSNSTEIVYAYNEQDAADIIKRIRPFVTVVGIKEQNAGEI